MPAFPFEARLLKPHLSYFAASRVPVLATSHVYSGEPNTTEDLDLERIRFGDMPIILLPTAAESEMLARVAVTSDENPADYARLFAFGADAYELAKRAQAMNVTENAEYQGRSGLLKVAADGEVIRELTWATFVDGYPLVDGHTRPDPEATPSPGTLPDALPPADAPISEPPSDGERTSSTSSAALLQVQGSRLSGLQASGSVSW